MEQVLPRSGTVHPATCPPDPPASRASWRAMRLRIRRGKSSALTATSAQQWGACEFESVGKSTDSTFRFCSFTSTPKLIWFWLQKSEKAESFFFLLWWWEVVWQFNPPSPPQAWFSFIMQHPLPITPLFHQVWSLLSGTGAAAGVLKSVKSKLKRKKSS